MIATKEQERKALEKIKKIIAELGEQSYIATAFDGCIEDAEENIENDFALSMKQRYDDALAKLNECEREKENDAARVRLAERDVEQLKEQLARAKEAALSVDELDACRTLASESYDLNIANANEYAKLIVRYAEFPTNKDFLDAVKKNRKFSLKAKQAKELCDALEHHRDKL